MGERGTLELDIEARLAPTSFCICSDKPRVGKLGRFGVVGLEKVSSLDTRRAGSRNAGEGDSVGLGASDNDRGFGVFTPVLRDVVEIGVRSPCSSLCARVDFSMVEETSCSARVAVDIVPSCADGCVLGSSNQWKGNVRFVPFYMTVNS